MGLEAFGEEEQTSPLAQYGEEVVSPLAKYGRPEQPSALDSLVQILPLPSQLAYKAGKAVVQEPAAAARGLVSGLTLGSVVPGSSPATERGKSVETGAMVIGSIPWVAASEGIAAGILARGGISALAPLSQTVLRATHGAGLAPVVVETAKQALAGAIFGAAHEVSSKGIPALARAPGGLARATVEAGGIGLASGPFVHMVAKFLAGTSKLPEPQRQAMGQAMVDAIEEAVHTSKPSRFKIIEALRSTEKRGTPFNFLLGDDDIAAIQADPNAMASLEAIARGRASWIGEGEMARGMLGPLAEEPAGRALIKIVEKQPDFSLEHVAHSIRSSMENNVPLKALLTSREQTILAENPAIHSLLEESIKQGTPFEPLLTRTERELLRGLRGPGKAPPWELEWAPMAPEEATKLNPYKGKLYTTEGDILLETRLRSRILEAAPEPTAANPQLMDEVIAQRYRDGIGNARANGGEQVFLSSLDDIRNSPTAWKQAVDDYAKAAGYDAVKFGEEFSVRNMDNFSVVLPGEISAELKRGLPALIPEHLIGDLPQVRSALATAPDGKQAAVRARALRGRGYKFNAPGLLRNMNSWARQMTAEERALVYMDPEVQAVNKVLNDTGSDIGPVHKASTNMAALADYIDKTGAYSRKLTYPFQQAEVHAQQFAHDVKVNIRRQLGKPGTDESAAMMRIGEGRAAAGDARYNTPQTRQKIAKMRQLYDWYLDQLNAVRGSIGLSPIAKRKDFFTHFNDLGHLQKIHGNLSELGDDMANKSFYKPTDPYFRSELMRTGGEFTDDAIGGLELYTDGAARYLFLTGPGTRILENVKSLPANSQIRNTFESMVSYAYGKTPVSAASNALRSIGVTIGKTRYDLPKLARRVNSNQIVGNIKTGLVQSGSIPFIFTQAGIFNTIKALNDIYNPLISSARRAMARQLSPAVASHDLDPREITQGAIGNLGRLVNMVVTVPDMEMSQLSFWAGMNKAKSLGLNGNAALVFANNLVNQTNATYLRSGTPEVLRGVASELALPFMRQMVSLMNTTWVDIAGVPSMTRMGRSIGGGSTIRQVAASEATSKLARLSVYSIGLKAVAESMAEMMGIKDPSDDDDDPTKYLEMLTQLIPGYNIVKYGISPPIFSVAKSAGMAAGMMLDSDEQRERRRTTPGEQLLKVGMMTLPPFGGKQVLRTLEGDPLGLGKKKE